MSMISKQVDVLRSVADMAEADGSLAWTQILREAADTIEELAAKLHAANMERSATYYNGGWIPCEDRLPDNAYHPGALCPRYMVMTEWGVTEGWYNPDMESWYVLLWFIDTNFVVDHIDFRRGDIPKVVRIPDTGKVKVTAWMPLPKPYNEESNPPEKITIEKEDGVLSAFYPYPAALMHSEENPCKVKQGRIGDSIWRQREMSKKITNQTTLKVREEVKHED